MATVQGPGPDEDHRGPRDERGAALVEYALLIALIALLCLVAVETIGRGAADTLSEVGNSISSGTP